MAAYVGARRLVVQAGGPVPVLVTVAINRVEFHQPVFVGDVVRCLVRLVKFGRTSITVLVTVEAERGTDDAQGHRGRGRLRRRRPGFAGAQAEAVIARLATQSVWHVVHRESPVLRRRRRRPGMAVARPDGDGGRHRQLRRPERRLQPDPHGPRVRQDDAVPPADRPRHAGHVDRLRAGHDQSADADDRVPGHPRRGSLPERCLAGDTIRVRTKVLAKELRGRGKRGEITWQRQLVNQEGKVVQEGTSVTLVECRPRTESAAARRLGSGMPKAAGELTCRRVLKTISTCSEPEEIRIQGHRVWLHHVLRIPRA